MADLGTVISKVTLIPAPWVQDVNDLTYRTTAHVYATGDAVSDTAALREAIKTLPAWGAVEIHGALQVQGTIVLKPRIAIRAVRGSITHLTAGANLFELKDQLYAGAGNESIQPAGTVWTGEVPLGAGNETLDAFPGFVFIDVAATGTGAPGGGEALGTLTWSTLSAAVFIEANCPFVRAYGRIKGFFAGVVLRGAYCSKVGGEVGQCRHGIMLYGESHQTVLDNPLVDGVGGAATGLYMTGLSINYGNPAGKVGITQSVCTQSGAYQRVDVGIWLESCQGFGNAGRIYFELNRQADIINGVPTSGAYNRTANFTQIYGANIASPCASPTTSPLRIAANGCNIQVHESAGVEMRKLGQYPGSGAPNNRPILYVDGFSGPSMFDWDALSGTNLFDFIDPDRVTIGLPGGQTRRPQNAEAPDQFFATDPLVPYCTAPFATTEAGGRNAVALGRPLIDNVDVIVAADKALPGSRAALGAWVSGALQRWLILNPFDERFECLRNIRMGPSTGIGQLANIPTIASAATIAPVELVSVVSGVTTIDTITVPAGWPTGGRLTLIPTGAWATSTSGNIQRAVSATPDVPLDFIWDGVLLKWWVK